MLSPAGTISGSRILLADRDTPVGKFIIIREGSSHVRVGLTATLADLSVQEHGRSNCQNTRSDLE